MNRKLKQKQVSIEEYIETYCQEKRVRERYAVYVSEETHDKLKRITRLFSSKHHTTTSSLVDAIISCHIKAHKELLNDALKKHDQELLDWLKNFKRSESEEPDDSSEEQPDDVEGEKDPIIKDESVE